MVDSSRRNDSDRSYRVVSDREEVRRWADDNDYVPVRRRNTDAPHPELVHRDEMGSGHEEHDWDTFHREFDDRNLVLVHETGEGRGRHRVVERDRLGDDHGETDDAVIAELLEGETVTTEVTEREVVETEVTKEATIESEVVGSEVVESEVVDTEIVSEELVGVAMAEETNAEVEDRSGRTYFGDDSDQVIEIEESGRVVLEIDETRIETVEQIEEKIVESRVVDEDIDQETRVEDESVDVDIDVGRVHEHLSTSDIVDTRSGDVIDERHVETEIGENNRATSTISEYSTIEREIDERKLVLAEVTDVEIEDSRVVNETVVDAGIVESGIDLANASANRVDTGSTSTDDSAGTTAAHTDSDTGTRAADREVDDEQFSDRLMGRDVELPSGDKIGIVADVDDEKRLLYVNEDPSLTDKIKASLHWGDEDDALVIAADKIRTIRSNAVVVENAS